MKPIDRDKIVEILGEVEQADSDASTYIQRKLRNWNTRYCIWPGQNEDGRKRKGSLGAQPFPWENSSDCKIFLSDNIC